MEDKERIGLMIGAIRRIARGDISSRLGLSGKNDELDALAGSINEMIDELKSMVRAKQEPEGGFRALFESMSLGVVYQNAHGYITSANPSAERILGLTLDQMQGRTSIDPRWKAIHSDGSDFPGDTHPSMIALKTGEEVRNVIMGVFNPVTGEQTWININAVPLTQPGEDKPYQVYTLFEDITYRKDLEEELKKYTDHLEDEVKRQTNELIQSEKMAGIGLLVAGVAHEVNNPLSYVKSNSNFLKQDFAQLKELLQGKNIEIELEEFEELIDTNIEGLERIAKITRALKRFARPDSGGRAFVNINEGIKDTLVMVNNQLKFRVKVHEDFGDIPMLDCNIGQLNQVFMNLIINASQAMDRGDLWIRTWSDDHDVYIRIRDNGTGIPPDQINNIFDPFYTTKESGTGLGLSISYRIIQEHRGEIVVESEGGSGTSMTIKLPVEV